MKTSGSENLNMKHVKYVFIWTGSAWTKMIPDQVYLVQNENRNHSPLLRIGSEENLCVQEDCGTATLLVGRPRNDSGWIARTGSR